MQGYFVFFVMIISNKPQPRYNTLSSPQHLSSIMVGRRKWILKTLFSVLILKYFQKYLNLQNSISKATKENLLKKNPIVGYFTFNKTTDYFLNWHLNEYFESKLTDCILTIEKQCVPPRFLRQKYAIVRSLGKFSLMQTQAQCASPPRGMKSVTNSVFYCLLMSMF